MTKPDFTKLEGVEFKPREASRDQWSAYHDYSKIRHLEVRPDDPLWPDDLTEKGMKRDDPFGQSRYFAVWHEGSVISRFSAWTMKPENPDYDQNKHLLSVSASALKEFRRNGLGRRVWLPLAAQLAGEYSATVLTAGTEEDEGHAFLTWAGFKPKQTGAENRLAFSEIDWELVAGWIREGPTRSPESKLEVYEEGMPEDRWGEYLPVYTEIINLQPFDDLDRGDRSVTPEKMREAYDQQAEQKVRHHLMLTREPDGAISGFTEIYYGEPEPGYIWQGLTGVRPPYRSRGLGKWLKAEMLEYTKKRYPDTKWVVTGNANSNDPMLSINKRLGFREYKGGTTYQLSVEELRGRLES